MIIEKLTMTNEEVAEAVEYWLATRGLSLKVSRVSKNYNCETEFTVEIKQLAESKKSKFSVDSTAPVSVQAEQVLQQAIASLGPPPEIETLDVDLPVNNPTPTPEATNAPV
jgi:hypothetical protein